MKRQKILDWANEIRQVSPEQFSINHDIDKWASLLVEPSNAIGHLPKVFPEDWEIILMDGTYRLARLKRSGKMGYEAVKQYFGLSDNEVQSILNRFHYPVQPQEITPGMVADQMVELANGVGRVKEIVTRLDAIDKALRLAYIGRTLNRWTR